MTGEVGPVFVPADQRIDAIALLRGVASLLVVYSHTVATVDTLQVDFAPHAYVKRYVLDPLVIIQNFGFFGVALFFLISGFIITHTIQRETTGSFVIKRVTRVLPAFWVAVIVTVIAFHVLQRWTGTPNDIAAVSTRNALWHLSLTDVLTPGHVAVIGVAWTLTIEMVFYFACAALAPVIRRRPDIAILAMLAFSAVFVRLASFPSLLPSLGYSRIIVAYLPMLIMGMVAWCVWSRRVTPGRAVFLALATWVTLVFNMTRSMPIALNSYLISFVEAGVLFVSCLLLGNRIRLGRLGAFFGDVSYSTYLYHSTFGTYAVLHLTDDIGFVGALLVALAITFALAYASFRLVERPAQRAVRSLLARRRARKDRELLPVPSAS